MYCATPVSICRRGASTASTMSATCLVRRSAGARRAPLGTVSLLLVVLLIAMLKNSHPPGRSCWLAHDRPDTARGQVPGRAHEPTHILASCSAPKLPPG